MPTIKKLCILAILISSVYAILTSFFFPLKNKKINSQFSLSSLSYRGPIDRSIELLFDVQNLKKSNLSEISVLIRIPKNFKGQLNYNWRLSTNLNLEAGSLTGFIDVDQEKKIVLKIKVNHFNTSELKHIRFEVSGDHLNRRIFSDGIISNQINESFEKIVTEIETYKKENI